MIVLDANILIRAILGRRVRQLLDTYAAGRARFVAPDIAYHAEVSGHPSHVQKLYETIALELDNHP